MTHIYVIPHYEDSNICMTLVYVTPRYEQPKKNT
jgi:hypothetical protein